MPLSMMYDMPIILSKSTEWLACEYSRLSSLLAAIVFTGYRMGDTAFWLGGTLRT